MGKEEKFKINCGTCARAESILMELIKKKTVRLRCLNCGNKQDFILKGE